jgi:hypothetical protein
MPRIARSARTRAAALAVAAATLSLPACRTAAPESAAAPSAPLAQGWALTPPQPVQYMPATASIAFRTPETSGPIQQVQHRVPAGASVPQDVAGGAPTMLPSIRTDPPTSAAAPVYPPGAAYPPGGPGCAPGGEPSDRFWGASRGWSDDAFGGRFRGFDDPADRPDWQNLPRLLGEQNRGPSGANLPPDLANGAPRNIAGVRTESGADPNGGTNSTQQVLFELASPDGRNGFGVSSGVRSNRNNDSQGLAPSLYGKRILTSSDDGVFGVGLGGTLPIGNADNGNIFPWVFGARRVTGDTWLQGVAGVNVPFSNTDDFFGHVDLGLVVPLAGRSAGPRGVKLYFMPELHMNYVIDRGTAGNPGFVLNSTMGFGARLRGVDVQIGMAFPLLRERFYDYESILRITYRF